MKRIIYLSFLLSLLSTTILSAQNSFKEALDEIEANNLQLKTLRSLIESEKLNNKTENNLQNPEVQLTQSLRNSVEPANSEIEVTQAFDFPTAYKYRGNVINKKNLQLDLSYTNEKKTILLEARNLLVEYVYLSKWLTFLQEREKYSRDLYLAYEELFEKGNITVLDRNKTKLNYLDANRQLKLAEADLETAKIELKRLNGGITLQHLPDEYVHFMIPEDFDTWFNQIKYNNPAIAMADEKILMSKQEETLAKSMNLPKLKVGYVTNLNRDKNNHGFIVGVSVPLWEGKNKVKTKKAQTIAFEMEKDDVSMSFKNELHANYQKAKNLSSLLNEYKEVIDTSNNFRLLKKSFDLGELSLILYIQELVVYHSAVDNYLATEKELELMLTELAQWE